MTERDAMLQAGLSFHQRGSLEEANACYQRAIEVDPDCDAAWYYAGRLAMDAGLAEEAESLLLRAIELAPDNADYLLTQGTLFARTGRLEDARLKYEKSLEINPALQEAYLGIAQTLALEGRHDEAANLVSPLARSQDKLGLSAIDLTGECRYFSGDLRALFAWWKGQGNDLENGRILHVGCGNTTISSMPDVFRNGRWQEVRLDIDASCQPDIVASITDMKIVPDKSYEAIYSSHNIEHLDHHDVPIALREFHRVLAPGGAAIIHAPDLQAVAALVAEDRLDDTAYISPAGPIAPIDMLYGHRKALLAGKVFMLHRTGFTASTLRARLLEAGFRHAYVKRVAGFALHAVGLKAIDSDPAS